MAKFTDIALIAGIAAVGFIIWRAGRDLGGFLSGASLPSLPNIDISLPAINLGGDTVETTYPNAAPNDQAILNEIQKQGGLANLQTQQIIDLLKGLTPLGSEGNPANAPTAPTYTDVILNDPTLSEAQKEDLLNQISPYNPAEDPNANPYKFNPEGVYNYGAPESPQGIPLPTGPQFQGPNINPETGQNTFLNPDQPLNLADFAAKVGITPAEAYKLQQNNPDLVQEISGAIYEPISGKSFEQGGGGQGIGSFSIQTNKPLTDIINQFKQLGFNLSASQAADIKAQLSPDQQVQDFDFGTNTGSALELAGANFGQGHQDLELQKAIQAAIASANKVFGGTSNYANPDFPITLGEAFLGKKGTIVSNSISNLDAAQLEAFKEMYA